MSKTGIKFKSLGECHKIFSKYEIVLIWIFFTIGILAFLDITGTLFSGFHLRDDEDYIIISDSITCVGLFRTLALYMAKDLSIRFRPIWSLLRVFDTYLFMDHYGILSIKNAIVMSSSATCFYLFAKKMNLNCFFSIMFPLVILLGEQSAVFWRLGPQESGGMLLFSLCMLATWYLENNSTVIRRILFIILLILLSLQKESFLVCIPAFFVLLFSLYIRNRKDNDIKFSNHFMKFIRCYFFEILISFLIVIVELCIIIFFVGTNSIGYAGVSAKDGIFYYLEGIYLELTRTFLPYLVLLIGFILFIQVIYRKGLIKLADILEFVFCAYIVLSQLVVYAKSGMYERYLLPATVGVAYVTIIQGYRYIHELCLREGKVYIAYVELVLLFLLFISRSIPSKALDFTSEANDFQEIISDIVENTSPKDKIILCSSEDFREIDISCGLYLQHYYGYSELSYLEDYVDEYSEIQSADVLFGVAGSTQSALVYKARVSKENYRIHETNHYEIAIKEVN